MKLWNISFALVVVSMLSACTGFDTGGPDKSRDLGTDSKPLSQLVAGVWVDPNGCDHWIIDDGTEGYLSARLDPMGKPVCSGRAAPTTVHGPYQEGSSFNELSERR